MADEPTKKSKRLVKNPETFRERAIKAADSDGRPKRSERLKTAGGKVTGPVFRPVARTSSKFFGFKLFRIFRRPLRIIGTILVPPYLRNSWKELRLVTWPSWRESRQLTVAVLIFAIVFGASIALVDYGLDKVFRNVLLK